MSIYFTEKKLGIFCSVFIHVFNITWFFSQKIFQSNWLIAFFKKDSVINPTFFCLLCLLCLHSVPLHGRGIYASFQNLNKMLNVTISSV